ncbi:unnamed protein product [Brassica rapa subsp. trilocularis]
MSRRLFCRLWQFQPRFSEASLCLSGFSLSQGQGGRVSRGGSIFPCLLSRLCPVSPTWRSGSALRRPGRALLLGLGRRFRASIWSVGALPVRRPSGILAISVLSRPFGLLSRLMFRFFCRTWSFGS